MTVDDTLDKRKGQYGEYRNQIQAKADIIDTLSSLYSSVHHKEIPTLHLMCLTEIVTKLTRCATNMHHTDSWHDLSGYAKLIEDVAKGEIDLKLHEEC